MENGNTIGQLQSIDYYGRTPIMEHNSKITVFDNISYNPQFEKLQVKSDRKDELLQLLRKYSVYVDKEDVLNTPEETLSL